MGFTEPSALAALTFLGVLLWIYLRNQRRESVDVSSLLLWEPVRDDPFTDRFRPDLLFWLQALLLALIALGMARPYWSVDVPEKTGRTVVLFDVSASMQTVENGRRRIDWARERAAEAIADVGTRTEVALITFGSRADVIEGPTRNVRRVLERIGRVEVTDGLTRLTPALQLARSRFGRPRQKLDLIVLTDVPRTEVQVPLAAGERLRYLRFGRSSDNVAVAALRVVEDVFRESADRHAYVVIKNFASREKEVLLTVDLDGQRLLGESLQLGARSERILSVSLPGAGTLEAALDGRDDFSVDDRALAAVRPARPLRVLAVTADEGLTADLERLASAVSTLDLRRITPKAYEEDPPREYDATVFHEFVPSRLPRQASLYIHPPTGNELVPQAAVANDVRILDWNADHPVLTDLRYLDALTFARTRVVSTPSWAEPLMVSRAGQEEFPLAFAGKREGHRVLVFAFDVAGHSIRRDENLSLLLLFLNAFRWLAPEDPSVPRQVDVGDVWQVELPEALPARIVHPDGEEESRSSARIVEVTPRQVGVHRIRFNGTERRVYANLFDVAESDVGRPRPMEEQHVEGAPIDEAPSERMTEARSLGDLLYVLALALMVVEWTVAARRRRAGLE